MHRRDMLAVEGPNAVALMVSGRKLTRLAAAAKATGNWIPIDLREPVEGQAVAIVDNQSARVEYDGQIHEFSAATGKWKHIDIHLLLDTVPNR